METTNENKTANNNVPTSLLGGKIQLQPVSELIGVQQSLGTISSVFKNYELKFLDNNLENRKVQRIVLFVILENGTGTKVFLSPRLTEKVRNKELSLTELAFLPLVEQKTRVNPETKEYDENYPESTFLGLVNESQTLTISSKAIDANKPTAKAVDWDSLATTGL